MNTAQSALLTLDQPSLPREGIALSGSAGKTPQEQGFQAVLHQEQASYQHKKSDTNQQQSVESSKEHPGVVAKDTVSASDEQVQAASETESASPEFSELPESSELAQQQTVSGPETQMTSEESAETGSQGGKDLPPDGLVSLVLDPQGAWLPLDAESAGVESMEKSPNTADSEQSANLSPGIAKPGLVLSSGSLVSEDAEISEMSSDPDGKSTAQTAVTETAASSAGFPDDVPESLLASEGLNQTETSPELEKPLADIESGELAPVLKTPTLKELDESKPSNEHTEVAAATQAAPRLSAESATTTASPSAVPAFVAGKSPVIGEKADQGRISLRSFALPGVVLSESMDLDAEPAVSVKGAAQSDKTTGLSLSENFRMQLQGLKMGEGITSPVQQADSKGSNRTGSLQQAIQTLTAVSGQSSSPAPARLDGGMMTLTLATPLQSPAWGQALNQQVIWMAGQGIKGAEIQINPQELGPVGIRIQISHDHQASVSFTSSHAHVRDSIEASLGRLRDALENQGINLADVDVSDQQPSEQRQKTSPFRSYSSGGSAAEVEEITPMSETLVARSMVDYYV